MRLKCLFSSKHVFDTTEKWSQHVRKCEKGLGQEFYVCRFDPHHLFSKFEDYLAHDPKCEVGQKLRQNSPGAHSVLLNAHPLPNERIRTCLYSRDHLVPESSFETHIKTCPAKPLDAPKPKRKKLTTSERAREKVKESLKFLWEENELVAKKLSPNRVEALEKVHLVSFLEIRNIPFFSHKLLANEKFAAQFIAARSLCTFEVSHAEIDQNVIAKKLVRDKMVGLTGKHTDYENEILVVANTVPFLGKFIEPPLGIILVKKVEMFSDSFPFDRGNLELTNSKFVDNDVTVTVGGILMDSTSMLEAEKKKLKGYEERLEKLKEGHEKKKRKISKLREEIENERKKQIAQAGEIADLLLKVEQNRKGDNLKEMALKKVDETMTQILDIEEELKRVTEKEQEYAKIVIPDFVKSDDGFEEKEVQTDQAKITCVECKYGIRRVAHKPCRHIMFCDKCWGNKKGAASIAYCEACNEPIKKSYVVNFTQSNFSQYALCKSVYQ
eukprot:TRINITY_DN1427_c0_g1_i2.p2 TRINITY_DN1427_c0_g1~~TRINITY_DN1427_c0_g1_i2.p2  ORF type:complete len:497 (-),score=70.12 TRINITY_DN1427_c0_g1_i2:8186-9676(-)